jgi:hypothetical protein
VINRVSVGVIASLLRRSLMLLINRRYAISVQLIDLGLMIAFPSISEAQYHIIRVGCVTAR